MPVDNISMREAARVLGVSQIRVRELIRKGTLAAEKVTENGQERWTILSNSVQDYLSRRPPRTDGQAPTGALGQIVSSLEAQLRRVRRIADELGEAQGLVDKLKAELARARDGAGSSIPEDPAEAVEFARKAAEAAKRAVEAARKEKGAAEKGAAEKGAAASAAPVPAPAEKPPAPKAEAPRAEAPRAQAPKAQAPKVQAPKVQAPKAEAPKPKQQAPARKAEKPAKAKPASPPASKAKKDDKSETVMAAALRQAGVGGKKGKPAAKGKKK